ncbi:putative acyltransferase YihG [Pseudomonas sp. OF001]|uniref:acyltransferase n=1 Tax=unclassified Pseudomonas TaxID=196821 RepID=UPI0010A6A1FC|nr:MULTISPECIES: acyltransferase [unclassified Pseudomonas]THG77140.1 acyltransferase [Pseudomonas sp. A-1]CAD5377988.1 putative acyltransferase YihG [Pseudomonas sp. OF001]
MLRLLPAPLRGLLSGLLLVLNTLLWCWPLLALALLKLLPLPASRAWSRRLMGHVAECWADGNRAWMELLGDIRWQVEGLEDVRVRGSCLVICNHQSWVDIFVLQRHLNRRLPLLRFFLKQELIWIPLFGLCCWALDFPFMKRHSRAYLERHPEQRGADLATTRQACARLRGIPVALFNFLEGTRFTEAKHEQQQSPYRHLLRPRAGGIALAIDAMGEQLGALVDVTIHYPDGRPRFRDLLCGRLQRVVVHFAEREIPAQFLGRSYAEDETYRLQFQQWVNGLWSDKDARLERLQQQWPPRGPGLARGRARVSG